jgi:hypothetical protein
LYGLFNMGFGDFLNKTRLSNQPRTNYEIIWMRDSVSHQP